MTDKISNKIRAGMVDKVIVTNKTALEKKYIVDKSRDKDNVDTILSVLDAITVSDSRKGISSFIVLIDNETQMKEYFNSPAVDDYEDEKQNKNAINAICKQNVKYILIFGSTDIIPHQSLKLNDSGEYIQSDIPYACKHEYSDNIEDFMNPEVNISRIPDIYGKQSNTIKATGNICKVLNNIARQKSYESDKYEDYFAVTSADWQELEKKAVKKVYGNNEFLHICPPETGKWSQKDFNKMSQYYSLYGFKNNNIWYSDKNGKNIIIRFEKDIAYLNSGTIVISKSSYSAYLSSNGEVPIPNIFMMGKAAGYLGVTGDVEHNTQDTNVNDELIKYFNDFLKDKQDLSSAFLNAFKKCQCNTKQDKAMFMKWLLLGDPSYSPIKNESEMDNMKRNVSDILKQMGIYEYVLNLPQYEKLDINAETITELPKLPENIKLLSPNNKDLKNNYIFVIPSPKTYFEDVRRVAGISPETVEEDDAVIFDESEDIRKLAYKCIISSDEAIEKNLSAETIKKIKDYIKQKTKILPVLVGKDLVVHDGEVVKIDNTAAAVFNSITIYGTGSIDTSSSEISIKANTIIYKEKEEI